MIMSGALRHLLMKNSRQRTAPGDGPRPHSAPRPRHTTANTVAGDRFDRSRGRSIESIDSIDSIIFWSLAKFLKNRSRRDDRSRQKSSKSEPSSRFFGRLKFFVNFDSIDSILRSIRSILHPMAMVDRPVVQKWLEPKWLQYYPTSSSSFSSS